MSDTGRWTLHPSAPPPPTRQEWEARRGPLRELLWGLLGDLPPLRIPQAEERGTTRGPGYTVRRLAWDNGLGQEVPALLLVPDGLQAPAPAVYYCHYHGGRYELGKDELWEPTPLGPTKAELLTRQGYVVLAIDAWCFGERRGRGPGGPGEVGGAEELSTFKLQLWHGRSLWGLMVRDDRLGLAVLRRRPEVDPRRIGALGMSMGCTRAWWLSAFEEELAAAGCVACLTRYQDLIATGALRAHGIYYFVPGLLRCCDTEAIIGLTAPRPMLTLSGDQDLGAPASGVRRINDWAAHLWGLYGAADRYRGLLYPGVGHTWTAEMWQETLAWFARWL